MREFEAALELRRGEKAMRPYLAIHEEIRQAIDQNKPEEYVTGLSRLLVAIQNEARSLFGDRG